MHTKQRNEAIRHVVAYIFTIVMVFLAVTPFIYVVLTALKTKEQIYDLSQIIPTHITFDNFRQVLFQSLEPENGTGHPFLSISFLSNSFLSISF